MGIKRGKPHSKKNKSRAESWSAVQRDVRQRNGKFNNPELTWEEWLDSRESQETEKES